jgi:PDZ domain-containing protein
MMPQRKPVRKGLPSLLTYVLLVITLALGVLWLIPANYYMILPGAAQPVSHLISIPGRASSVGGNLYDTYVNEFKATRLLYVLFGLVRDDVTIEPAAQVNDGCPDQQYQELLQGMMADSKIEAEAAALHVLGYKIGLQGNGPEIVEVLCNVPAAKVLRPGDRILAVDGHRVHFAVQVAPFIQRHVPGSIVHLTIGRHGKILHVAVRTVHADAEGDIVPQGGHALVGILTTDPLKFPVKIHINSGDVGGPSAGLMFALGIIEQLTHRDITHGNKVAGTGTISCTGPRGALDCNGVVGPIGGARQKAIAAQAAGATYFLVPKGNYAEARSAHTHLKIVPVSSLKQALQFLSNLKPPV